MTDHKPPKLPDQVRHGMRAKRYSIRTEDGYVGWLGRFILFHRKQHPREMGENEISAFLTHLAVAGKVSASTRNRAFCALLLLYSEILDQDLDRFQNVVWAKKPSKLPVVFTREEVRRVFAHMDGTCWLMASLLYGSGLLLMEWFRLRVKDVDFGYRKVIVRDGKGGNDRATVFPETVMEPLKHHLARVKLIHAQDLKEGYGDVYMPTPSTESIPMREKSGDGGMSFPLLTGPRIRVPRRSAGTTSVRRSCRRPSGKPFAKPASSSMAHVTHFAQFCDSPPGSGLRHKDVQELLGHEDVSTTMIYTHLMNKGGKGVLSPLDKIGAPRGKGDVTTKKREERNEPEE